MDQIRTFVASAASLFALAVCAVVVAAVLVRGMRETVERVETWRRRRWFRRSVRRTVVLDDNESYPANNGLGFLDARAALWRDAVARRKAGPSLDDIHAAAYRERPQGKG